MGRYKTMFNSDEEAVAYAVSVFNNLFSWEYCADRIPEQTIRQIGKHYGLTKGVLQEVRRRMSAQIEYEDGVKYWVVNHNA